MKVIWEVLDLRCKRYRFWAFYVVKNSIKLRKMVLKGKDSWVTISHFNQQQKLLNFTVKKQVFGSNVPKCPMCIDCPITLSSFIVLLLKIVNKLVNFPKSSHYLTSSNSFAVQFPYIHPLPMSPSSFIGSISQMPNFPKYIHLSHWNPISHFPKVGGWA